MDLRAIADAIAAQYVGISATVNGTTESLAATPTALLPNTVARGPVIIVNPPEGELEIGTSAIRQGVVRFDVLLLRDPVNVPQRTAWLYAWDAAMRDRVEQNLDLGLPGYVAIAEVTTFSLGIDSATYAGANFDAVTHTVEVTIYEQSVTVGV